MRINRFYLADNLKAGSTIQLNKEVSGHISRVLRLKVDTEIQVFNGDGKNYQAKIINTGKTVVINITSSTTGNAESPLIIHLGQAISRSERMDFTLQKSVELGVHTITPIVSERVQFRFDEKRIIRKMNHWQKIIESSCEQSGRTKLPILNKPMALNQWLDEDDTPGLLLVPKTETRLKDIQLSPAIRLLVGPEGGLSDNEVRQSLANQAFSAITLGPRILRTETAALTTISILQSQFGDI